MQKRHEVVEGTVVWGCRVLVGKNGGICMNRMCEERMPQSISWRCCGCGTMGESLPFLSCLYLNPVPSTSKDLIHNRMESSDSMLNYCTKYGLIDVTLLGF